MLELIPKHFPNTGWLETKLSPDILNFLSECIKDGKENINTELAGNIEKSFIIEDPNNWFFKNVLVQCIEKYTKEFTQVSIPKVLTKNCGYILNRFWVNFQKKYEFNPIHNHTGVFSFVIWMKIPSSFKKECNLPFIKDSNHKSPNTFQLVFSNSLGHISTLDYHLEPSHEGTMLFFPAQLNHQVYPFYTSTKNRISISGNICFNPDNPI
jgi:hypothetical protein